MAHIVLNKKSLTKTYEDSNIQLAPSKDEKKSVNNLCLRTPEMLQGTTQSYILLDSASIDSI